MRKDPDKVTQEQDRMMELQRENETLSQQVKRLIMAETKLYEYQEELDVQLKEYKDLYELNKKLNVTLDLGKIFQYAVEHVVQNLDFERAILLQLNEEAGSYRVYALDGYYAPEEKDRVEQLTLDPDAQVLRPLFDGAECLICTDDAEGELTELRAKLLMDEFFIYPVGAGSYPTALLVVGNCAESAEYYRKVNEDAALISMGNLVGLISTSVDNCIFCRAMERALEHERVAEAKYRSIFDNAVEGIFQRTPAGKYLDANPSLARMLGYASPHDFVSSVTDAGTQLYVRPEVFAEITRHLEEKGAVERFEAEMYCKDRSVIWVSVSARTVRNSAGEVLYYEGTTEEITERKRAEEALRESERKYRQLSEALEQRVQEAVHELRQKDEMLVIQGRQAVMGEMLSNIAHQWRQPLNILGLLVQDLKMTKGMGDLTEEYIDSNVNKTLEIIDGMSKTIDDFRYFFRTDKEKMEFSIYDILQKSLSLLEGGLAAHGIVVDVERSGNPTAVGFPGQFTQVLLNILINARDALIKRKTAAPSIKTRIFTEEGKTVVTITDNAGGIPEEIIHKVFDPYFSTKGPEQGTGIGLYMCKNIIEKNMGGTLSARNADGGAEFRIEV
ncbi:PAS domain-containing sensor histidine kinase [Geomonas sp. RF6]|uniref:sensor histidine kinase n=1 Tax=Geomonas sp. RF6 TaxID=2897342 RepID=UPI001E6007DB|nr:PAS domain-containing sensor histidine kinase [Geomonas sp. RF6]UFS71464.1 PAS domain-containing sensor histidine kinase [Geomonas sp. RF6]